MAGNEESVMDFENSDRPSDAQSSSGAESSDAQPSDADNVSDEAFADQQPPKKKLKISQDTETMIGSQVKDSFVKITTITKKTKEGKCTNCSADIESSKTTTRNFYDPQGAKLCQQCGGRLKQYKARAKKANVPLTDKWRTLERMPTSKLKEDKCSNCSNSLSAKVHRDLENKPLCGSCGQRLWKEKVAAKKSGVPVGDGWRHRSGKARKRATKYSNRQDIGDELGKMDVRFKCTNCPNRLSAQKFADPEGKALCGACGQRLIAARSAAKKSGTPLGDEWRTPKTKSRKERASKDNSGEGDEGDAKKLKCGNCPNRIGAGTKSKDPQGKLLCPDCSGRLRYATRAAELAGRPVGEQWRTAGQNVKQNWGDKADDEQGRHQKDPDDSDEQKYCYCNRGSYGEMVACDNEACPREWFHLGCTELTAAPSEDEEWYCRDCRPRRVRPAGGVGGPGDETSTCEDCETELLDNGRDDNLCEVCGKRHDAYDDRKSPPPNRPSNASIPFMPLFTHAAIRDTAYESFRGLHPSFDPRIDVVRPAISRNDYWNWENDRLTTALRSRGVLGKTDKRNMIRWMQIADALDGVLPNPDPTGASRVDRLSTRQKISLALPAGFNRRADPGRPTSDNLRDFLIDPDAPFVPDALASDDLACIARLLLQDLSASLPNQPNRAKAIAEQATHQTHNRGLTGSEAAIQSLRDTMRYNLFPGDTSGAGLLCGARALASSRVARLQTMGLDPGMDAEEMTHRLMELLFTNYDRTTMPDSDMVGIPTPEYDTYLRDQLTLLAQTDVVHFNEEYFQRTALNNVDVEQVAAMAYLAHQAQLGGVAEDFGLGVVVAAHTRRVHDGTVEDVPAHARIVRNGAAGTPVIWIHHNTALSLDEYSHFEAFVLGDRLDALTEWGIETGASADVVPPPRVVAANYPGAETRAAKLRREITNAQTALRYHLAKFRKHCRRCRNLEFAECIGKPGDKCERCVKDKQPLCHWDYDAPFVPSGKSGSELMDPTIFEEHMKLWDVPMSMQERAEYEEFARNNQPQPCPEGEHMLIIGCGRQSSHGGMESMQRVSGCIMITITTLWNLWNSPQHNNTPEGQRPGGPGAVRRLFTMPIARHGTRRIPCSTGNVQDPILISHTNLIDQEMNPNNANPAFEIIYVLMGIAGLSVPLEGWVPFFRSILRRDAANGTNIADRIFIMPVVESDVVNGTATSIFPNRPLHTWLRYRNKCVRKFKLRDLYERWLYHRHLEHCRQNNLLVLQVPMTPALQDLDDMLELMEQEGCWRSGDYDNVTIPTAATLADRNNGRNAAWQ